MLLMVDTEVVYFVPEGIREDMVGPQSRQHHWGSRR